jgi:uncharacterized membrane protein YidH (DUF202 family)
MPNSFRPPISLQNLRFGRVVSFEVLKFTVRGSAHTPSRVTRRRPVMFADYNAHVCNEHVRAVHAAYGAVLGPPPVDGAEAHAYATRALDNELRTLLDNRADGDVEIETLDAIASRIVLISRYLFASVSSAAFSTEIFRESLRALSEAYRRRARDGKEDTKYQGEQAWVPPDTFQRQTMKFWVQLQDVIALKVEILKRLPILYAQTPSAQNEYSPLVTSVYLENADFDVYRTRLLREEGSTLVRFRWYGGYREDADVYVEKKTHFGGGKRSVKERRRVRSDALASLFEKKGGNDGILLGKFVSDIKTEEIERRGLKPTLSTCYSRTAFQLPTTNAVRISLDEDLRWSDVRALGTRAMESPTNVTYSQRPFPYAVLEVKLAAADAATDWIENILSKFSVVKVYKFSKYIHGCATLMPHAVYKLPHWFDEQKFDAPKSRFASSGSFAELLRASITTVLGLRKNGVANDESRSGSDGEPPDVEAPDSRRLQTTRQSQRHVPVKVEPKTFFANERTLLQWLSMAILLLFLGLGLMTLETTGSAAPGGTPNVSAAAVFGGRSRASAVCGVIIAPIAVVFMIYALWTFIVRARRIARREPSTRYDDVFGPVALVVILCVVATASIALSAANIDWNRHSYARLTSS